MPKDEEVKDKEVAKEEPNKTASEAGLIKDDDPSGFQSRMNDIYGKMKASDRKTDEVLEKLKERDEDIRLMREHNQQLSSSIGAVKAQVETANKAPAPDPDEDMGGYLKWMNESFDEKLSTMKNDLVQSNFDSQVSDMQDDHDDYERAVKIAQAEMGADPSLKQKILNSRNPAKAAYKYGKKKLNDKATAHTDEEAKLKEEEDRKKAIDQGQVEGSTNGGDPGKKVTLDAAQKRVAKLMNISEEKYAKQLASMGV